VDPVITCSHSLRPDLTISENPLISVERYTGERVCPKLISLIKIYAGS